MSVLTCRYPRNQSEDNLTLFADWWGFELVLPPTTLVYLQVRSVFIFYLEWLLTALLQRGQSISKTVINFLTAMAAVNNGVREILPFVRYISQFLEFEFNTILGQNQGLGVVCAATW